ncbi:universal stress protein [Halorarum halophilum]|uniref:Universal stress protein n=1 Tax=Halorarum halophilum TaxID=2743090 RepID=A0A7D5GA19_9EURY|nr:universal stress protein [Halobaculum halophilum]QLG26266.1 universal stress protein [Halobaculum halophilum]
MVKRILVAFDGTDQSVDALEYAASEWPDAELVLLTVIDPSEAGFSAGRGVPSGAEEWYETMKAKAEGTLADGAALVDREVETVTEVGKPREAIVEYAEADHVDHIVVGSHGRQGFSRIVLGSVAEGVVRTAPVPVTVVR